MTTEYLLIPQGNYTTTQRSNSLTATYSLVEYECEVNLLRVGWLSFLPLIWFLYPSRQHVLNINCISISALAQRVALNKYIRPLNLCDLKSGKR